VEPPSYEHTVVTSPGTPLEDLERSARRPPPGGSLSSGRPNPTGSLSSGRPNPTGARAAPHRPFRFRDLPQVSRAQALMTERIEWLMPSAGADRVTADAICTRLKELFDEEVRILLDHIQVLPPPELPRIVREPTFLAVLAPSPQGSRGLLEIDLGLCHASIDKLLGGSGDALALRPLTDIEEGVMGFIILEALKTLAPNLDQGLPRPRLEGGGRSVGEAVALLSEEQQVVVIQLKSTLGTQGGFLRLFLPASLVGMTNPPGEGPERRARRRAAVERNLTRLKNVKTWLRAEIGRAEISNRDLQNVDTGDVVLLDELTARPDKNEGGTARLRIGAGKAGRLLAEIALEGGHYRAKVTGFELGEEPKQAGEAPAEAPAEAKAGAPAEAKAAEAQDSPEGGAAAEEHTNPGIDVSEGHVSQTEQGEGSDLLADIPLQIAVELARVPVSAEQVVALKTGQVIDLNKVPGEPVEMSVNGKVVARGELVEIEGHLGVRILSLVG